LILIETRPYNEFLFLCEHKWNSNKDIFDTHRNLFAVQAKELLSYSF
jgi:hypothetical protein